MGSFGLSRQLALPVREDVFGFEASNEQLPILNVDIEREAPSASAIAVME